MNWVIRLLPSALAASFLVAFLVIAARSQALGRFKDKIRKSGWRGALKFYGWKVFALIFIFYLIRDVTLYILLPWLVARGLIFGTV